MPLADLIQEPGFNLAHPRLTLDFSKPVVRDSLKRSFSGGNPDNQVIVYRFSTISHQETDLKLEAYLNKWIEPYAARAVGGETLKEEILANSMAILSRFKKLLALMASYPNKKENVLK